MFYCAYYNRSKSITSSLDEEIKKELVIYGDISSRICDKYDISGGQIGSGYNFEEKKVDSLYFSFHIQGKFDIESSRALIIPVYLECLKEINSRIELAHLIYPFPFNIKNIEVCLSFRNKSNYFTEKVPNISKIYAFNGGIEYLSYTGRDDYYKEPSHREDFATAYSLTKHQLSKDLQEVAEKAMRSDVIIPDFAASGNKYLRDRYPDL